MGKLLSVIRRLLAKRDVQQLLLYLSLNFGFMFIELCYGVLTNSLGLISDAVHMLFDCLAVVVALVASGASVWPATDGYVYGLARFEVLGGFVNGILLFFTSFGIMVSSIERMLEPRAIVHSDQLFVVACVGCCVNVVGLVLFHEHAHGHVHGSGGNCSDCGDKSVHSCLPPPAPGEGCDTEVAAPPGGGSRGSANMRGMFLHILGDTLGSAAVVVSSLVVRYFDWTFFDTVTSVSISLMLFLLVWPLIQSTAFILLQRQPTWLDSSLQAALGEALRIEGICGIRCARFWCVTPKRVEGSVCVSVLKGLSGEGAERVRRSVTAHFAANGVDQMAVQLERDADSRIPPRGPPPLPPIDAGYVAQQREAFRKDA